MIDSLLVILLVLSLPFPLVYAIYKKLNNKLLFVFASYGADSIIAILFAGLSIPLFLLTTYMFPQLDAVGYSDNIKWLYGVIRIFEDYGFLLIPITLFIFPVLIHRRYISIFGSEITHNHAN